MKKLKSIKNVEKSGMIDCILMIISIIVITIVMLNIKWIQSLDGDNAPQTYAIYTVVGKSLHNGELPLWNPYIWGGLSNIGAPITEAFYPINWLLCYIFYDVNTELVSYAIIPWNLIIHICIYFVGMFFLLKKIGVKTFWSILLSSLSICCYAFSSYFTWVVYFDGFCWFPLLILFSLKLIESESKEKTYLYTVILGVLFAIEALLSVSLMLTITATFVLLLFIIHGLVTRKNCIQDAIKIVLSGIIGILLSSPVILCTIKFLLNGARYVDDSFIFGLTKVPWNSFVAHKVSFEDAESIFNVLPVNSWLSLGGILILLCIFGIFIKRAQKDYFHIWVICGLVFSLLYCIGFIVTDFAYYIPFLNNLRETYMYGCVVDFLATIMAGYGIVSLNEEDFDNYYPKKVIIILMFAICIYNLLPHKITSYDKVIMSVLLIVSLLLVFTIKKMKNIGLIVLSVCSILSICIFLKSFNVYAFDEVGAIQHVKQVNDYNGNVYKSIFNDRNARFISVGNAAYPSNQGAALGIREDANYFNPSTAISIKCNTYIDFVKRSQLHNVRYWLINSNNDETFINWWNEAYPQIKYTGTNMNIYSNWSDESLSEIMVYESQVTLGEAWIVSNVHLFSSENEEEIFGWLNSQDVELDKIAGINEKLLSESDKVILQSMDNEEVLYSIKDVKHKYNRIEYNVESQKQGVLVISEIYDSGWKVYVNGEKANVLNADYSNMAVIIPEGDSTISFVYMPNEYVIGVCLQVLIVTILLVGGFLIVVKNKKKDA